MSNLRKLDTDCPYIFGGIMFLGLYGAIGATVNLEYYAEDMKDTLLLSLFRHECIALIFLSRIFCSISFQHYDANILDRSNEKIVLVCYAIHFVIVTILSIGLFFTIPNIHSYANVLHCNITNTITGAIGLNCSIYILIQLYKINRILKLYIKKSGTVNLNQSGINTH